MSDMNDVELIEAYLNTRRKSEWNRQRLDVTQNPTEQNKIMNQDYNNHTYSKELYAELKSRNYDVDKINFDFVNGRLWIQDVQTKYTNYKTAQAEN